MMYLGGPIDAASDDEHNWRTEARELIGSAEGWVAYDPYFAWVVNPQAEIDNKIAHVNRLALGMSSALIVHLPDERTAGTFMEIAWAERRGVPIAWFGDDRWADHWSLALRGIQRVPDVESAMAWCIGHTHENERRQEVGTTLHVQKLSVNAVLPTKAHNDDAGWDLYVTKDTIIKPGKWEDVPLGIAIQPPPGVWFRIVGRSSTFRKRRILVLEGIIDEGYRGELFVGCTNLGDTDVEIKAGERICQMLPGYTMQHFSPAWSLSLSAHARGSKGFGSSGS